MNNQSFIETPDNVLYDIFLKWLNEETIKKISFDLEEPDWMLQHRLESFKIFKQIKKPDFGPDISSIDFDNLVYYAKPKKWFVWAADSRDKVPQNIISLLHLTEQFEVVELLCIFQSEFRFLILCRHISVWILMNEDNSNIHLLFSKMALHVVILNDALHQNMINVHCMQVVWRFL